MAGSTLPIAARKVQAMRKMTYFGVAGALAAGALAVSAGSALGRDPRDQRGQTVQLGPRPFYLVDGMSPSPLKERLEQCKDGPFRRSDFSIGHRGAALQFPEHTKQSYEAGARMGAGIVECDTTFTKDGELVCRHSECDLHTTTNIVATELNAQCSVPWTGPDQDPGHLLGLAGDRHLLRKLHGPVDGHWCHTRARD